MKRQIEAAFEAHRSVMVQMPTGTGKTVLLASIVKDEGLRVGHPCVWIVAHRRELVEQIETTLARMLSSDDWRVGLEPRQTGSPFVKVMSVQWLSRHYLELDEEPTLIVIDEAHHAVAKTYSEVMTAYPEARKLGVTATPCRMNKRGFAALFEVLLCSRSIPEFIKEGYLSDFDYMSLTPDSEDQRKIDGLEKRAADGDYNIAEMQSVLDCRPSIGRLYRSVAEFVEGKKGIVYAINIEHAEHIADYYREQGLKAVAISSKTPKEKRSQLIELFRNTNGGDSCAKSPGIQILVNVDLFGEGFDCPDVEFIQLARPTLSLAKYLQMVGRGLRVAKDKECCTILDNVGLYRLFGLPTLERNWDAMFFGKIAGKGEAEKERDDAMLVMMEMSVRNRQETMTDDSQTEMVVIARHNEPKISQRLSELLYVFHTMPHIAKMRSGYMGGGRYIRTKEPQGLYNIINQERMGWQLISQGKDEATRYYLLHTNNERMVYVGRKCPWTRLTDGLTEMYCYANEYAHNGLEEVDADEPEYITGEKYQPQENGIIRKDRWGGEHIVTFVYYSVGRNRGKEFDSKDAYVCEHFSKDEYAICNNNHHIILRGLRRVRLMENNIAEVIFKGENERKWVNLYTMQEFDKYPIMVRSGFIEMLSVGGIYYFYRNRQLAGIPIRECDYAANGRLVLFMGQYVILKAQPSCVYRIDDEYRKGSQWLLKLKNIGLGESRADKEIPSVWIPKKQ